MAQIAFSLAALFDGFVSGAIDIDVNEKVNGLAWDSRRVKKGDLFFACNGELIHGKQFIQPAVDSGATAIALETDDVAEAVAVSERYNNIPVIAVSGLTKKLGHIASRFYGDPSKKIQLIGVTGTNGKTSVTHFLSQCLSEDTRPCGVIGTMGAGLWGELREVQNTTPGAVELQQCFFELNEKCVRYVAMEVSSHGLAQGRTAGCDFNIAVFTNLTQDHLDYHGSMAAYGKAKLALFTSPKLTHVVVNLDDAFSQIIIDALSPEVKVIGVTLNPEKRNMSGVDVVLGQVKSASDQGMTFSISSKWGGGEVTTGLLGDFNVSNLLTVLVCVIQLDFAFDDICQKLTQVKAPKGRLERFGGGAQPMVVVDYAHTPDALEKVLLTLKKYTVGKLFLLFGCGGNRDKSKRPKMGTVAEAHADVVWLTNDNPRTEAPALIIDDVLQGVSQTKKVIVEPDRKRAIQQLVGRAKTSDVVLIAGKGHESYQIIGEQRYDFSDRDIVIELLKEAV